MNKKNSGNLSLEMLGKSLIAILAIAQLVFTSIHVKALLLLENEICGFVMFLLVLFGLITLFESTRIKNNQLKEKIITAVLAFVTAGVGACLLSIYRFAIENQASLKERGNVDKAVVFTGIIIIMFVIAGIFLLIDSRKNTIRSEDENNTYKGEKENFR